LSRGHVHDTEAYTKYLKGLHLWNKWTPEDAREAIRYFEESIELDPTCSLPHSALSSAYVFLGGMGQLPPGEAFPKAREAATRAIDLESDVGESHAALGVVKLFHDWDVKGAYESIQKGLSIAPGSAWIHHMYGLFLMIAGDPSETVEAVSTALQLDPLSLPINSLLGDALSRSRRYGEARQQFERVLDLDPEFRVAEEGLAMTHLATGGVEEAIRILEQIPRRTGDRFKAAGLRGLVYAIAGREHDARRMLQMLEERRSVEPDVSLHVDFAVIHTALGEIDAAFEYLEQSVEERLGFMLFLRTSPMWDPLKHDPRFGRLMDRIGISEEKGWG
jgi:tetratricopeptide (TPR) repeat protein